MTYPLIREFASAIPGDGFDGWQNYWNLWWMKVALIDHIRWPFTTDLLYYPTGVTLHFHTLNPFNGLLVLPVQLSVGLLPAYNTVVLFAFAVGGYGAYLLALQALRSQGASQTGGRNGAASTALGPGAPKCRTLSLDRVAAFVGGLVYTFAPFHFAHLLGHMQVIALQWIPFYVLYLLRSVRVAPALSESGKRRWLLGRDVRLAAFFLLMVGLCDWYYVFYCLLFSIGLLIYLVLRKDLRSTMVFGVAFIWLLFALMLSPVLVPMIREASAFRFMVPDPVQTRSLSADLLAFVTPQEMHPLWGQKAAEWSSRFTSTTSERMVFAGYTPLLLALVAVLPRRLFGGRERPKPGVAGSVAVWMLSLSVFFVLSLGPVLHYHGRTALLPGGGEIILPYGLLHRIVPFLDISRSVSRFDVMVMLSLAVLAAFGMARIMGWLERVRGRTIGPRVAGGRRFMSRPSVVAAVGCLSACMILYEFLPAPYPMSPPDTPAWYFDLGAQEGDFAVLNLPMNWDRPGYLLYQTVHQKRLTAAYISRDDPRTLVERMPVLQDFRHLAPDVIDQDLATVAPSVFDYLGVRYVVLDNYKMPAGGREREETVRLSGEVFGDAQPVYSDSRLTVFVPERASTPIPFIILGEGWGPRMESDGDPRRQVLSDATLLVHSGLRADLRLRLTAQADVQTKLAIWLGDTVVGRFRVDIAAGDYLSEQFNVAPGDTVLRLQADSGGGIIAVSRLALEELALSEKSTSH